MTLPSNIQKAAITSLGLSEKLQRLANSGDLPRFSTETASLLIGLTKDEVIAAQSLLTLLALQGDVTAATSLFDLGMAIGLAAGAKASKEGQ